MEFIQCKVAKIIERSENVRVFHISLPEGRKPPFQPGQFFILRLPAENGKFAQRPYSIASSPWEEGLIFAIRFKGQFTSLLWKLKEGDAIDASGPFGLFLLNPEDKERVFIGGGVGASPLRSMILQSRKDGVKSSFFHSARKFAGLVFFDEMQSLSKDGGFEYFPSITGDERPGGWTGLCERISVAVLKRGLSALPGKTFYVCGPKALTDGLLSGLQSEGVPKESIKVEGWG